MGDETDAPTMLRTDRRTAPLGLDSRPEFSWRSTADQDAYEVEVSTGTEVWSSGWVESAKPFGAAYRGPSLGPAQSYTWRVRVRGAGRTSRWSDPASFETGLLAPADWSAQWICEPPRPRRSPPRTRYFQHRFDLPAPVVRARAYASALGWYRLLVGGTDVTGPALVPRFTPFDAIVEYQVYDVTDALTVGANDVQVVVSEGRFRGALGTASTTGVYGDRLATIVQIRAELEDGSTVTVGTGPAWSVGLGPLLVADPKKGERFDARIPDTPHDLVPAHLLPAHPRQLVAEEVDRVTAVGRLGSTASRTPSGAQLFDLGRNINGVAAVRLQGPEGTRAVIRYSEVLTPAGELDMDYLEFSSAKDWFQRDEVLLGAAPLDYTPTATIRGFRYVTVEGAGVTATDLTGIELSTPLETIGEFRCSDPRLEQMDHTTTASLRANFSDTATDCPTRERTGWTGDVQVFAPTAAIKVDVAAFLRRYLRNLALEQRPDGRVPSWIPAEESAASRGVRERILSGMTSSVGWGDAAVLVPWTLYQYHADEATLRAQWPSALAWVEQLERRARRSGRARRRGHRVGPLERFVIDTGFHFGEWLRPGESSASTMLANLRRPPAEIATAYFALSSGVLAQMAEVLGHTDQALRWRRTAADVRQAWRAAFVSDGGRRVGLDRQDDYVRALQFDLLLPEDRPRAAARLAELVTAADDHLATGFLSTPLLLQALSDNGHPEVAYRVLLQESAPSWLGQLDRGATTWWETWEGYHPDGRAKVSHDHYAFGSVSRWLYEHIGGLRPLEPGYRRFLVAPVVGGGLSSASVSVVTPYGPASNAWTVEGDRLTCRITVPAGTTAVVGPAGEHGQLPPGDHVVQLPTDAVDSR